MGRTGITNEKNKPRKSGKDLLPEDVDPRHSSMRETMNTVRP
jgi:hypothetical protein